MADEPNPKGLVRRLRYSSASVFFAPGATRGRATNTARFGALALRGKAAGRIRSEGLPQPVTFCDVGGCSFFALSPQAMLGVIVARAYRRGQT